MIEAKTESEAASSRVAAPVLPVTVIVPVRNEARNLPRCLDSLRGTGEVLVIDSQSSDETCAIAESFGARVVQFQYAGGWPKKRQWALDTIPLAYDWILLLDADETMTAQLFQEIRKAIQNPQMVGYRVRLQMYFLGKLLRHCDASFWKLSLFRKGQARFECRLKGQDASMADMEVHEHMIADGPVGALQNPLVHHNVESLSRYIRKHDEYSNWEARVLTGADGGSEAMAGSPWGTQAERRRWLKKKLYRLPGSPALLFFYRYVFRFGFLDGVPGLIYCTFQAVQMFHTKAKIYELKKARS